MFLFPSLFEGLSIVGLEAQANGIPIVCSDTAIGEEGLINSNVKRLLLTDSIPKWCDEINRMIKSDRLSKEAIEASFRSRGFDIEYEARIIGEFFNQM